MWLLVFLAGYPLVIELASHAIHLEQVFSAQKAPSFWAAEHRSLASVLRSHRVICNAGHQLTLCLIYKEHGEINWTLTICPWQEDMLYRSAKIKF